MVPRNVSFEAPAAAHCPSTRVGTKLASANFGVSKTSLCIFLSRLPLPLCALSMSTTISPCAWPVAGSNRSVPRFNRKVPWTVWAVAGSDHCIVVRAGSNLSAISCAVSRDGKVVRPISKAVRPTSKPLDIFDMVLLQTKYTARGCRHSPRARYILIVRTPTP